MKRALIGLLSLALSSGCQKSSPPGGDAEKGETDKAPAAAQKTDPPKADDSALPPLDDIPTEEDYLDEVEKQITDDADLETELDALEKEINE